MSTDEIRILKKATCPTLSGKSTLTYHIGCTPDDKIHLRVFGNNGGGFFSQEWVPLAAIQQALSKRPEDITSVVLYGLFRGKSANTPGFLLAVLKAEKLIQPIKGKRRKHALGDSKDLQARIAKLMSGETRLKTTRKRAAVKKKVTPARARKR